MSLFRWFIVRQMRRDAVRSLVTVAGVAVGIAVVVAIRLANESSVRGFETALEAISGRVSLEVVSPGVGVNEDRLLALDWLRDYGRVSPVIDGDALIRPAGTNRESVELVRVLGVDDDLGKVLGVLETHVFPARAAVDAPVDSVAETDVATAHVLTGADPDH